MSQPLQSPSPDTSGSPGLLGGALALLWIAVMGYGSIATWGGAALLKQPPGLIAMLGAIMIFPAFGLWMLVGAWRTAWLTGLRQTADSAHLAAHLDELRADVAALAAGAIRSETSSTPRFDMHGAPVARLTVTQLSARFTLAAPAPPAAAAVVSEAPKRARVRPSRAPSATTPRETPAVQSPARTEHPTFGTEPQSPRRRTRTSTAKKAMVDPPKPANDTMMIPATTAEKPRPPRRTARAAG